MLSDRSSSRGFRQESICGIGFQPVMLNLMFFMLQGSFLLFCCVGVKF